MPQMIVFEQFVEPVPEVRIADRVVARMVATIDCLRQLAHDGVG